MDLRPIVHDSQLAEDPELLQPAGAAALLCAGDAELESAWKASPGELSDSRARLASAAERERRKLERDLDDGAQQRLVAATINLTLDDKATDEGDRHERIADARTELELRRAWRRCVHRTRGPLGQPDLGRFDEPRPDLRA